MRRADRLFDIIQTLRGAACPVTAAALADRFEVTPRTIYRDIAALQARQVPIEGAAGMGYVLRRGYSLPPLSFTAEEIEAIAVGLRLIGRLRDDRLDLAAENVLSKLAVTLPAAVRDALGAPRIWVSEGSAARPVGVDPGELRGAIRACRKLRIAYVDAAGRRTRRTICPIAMVYYVDVTLIAAWCELRADLRHFRIERIERCTVLDETFAAAAAALMRRSLAARGEDGAGKD